MEAGTRCRVTCLPPHKPSQKPVQFDSTPRYEPSCIIFMSIPQSSHLTTGHRNDCLIFIFLWLAWKIIFFLDGIDTRCRTMLFITNQNKYNRSPPRSVLNYYHFQVIG